MSHPIIQSLIAILCFVAIIAIPYMLPVLVIGGMLMAGFSNQGNSRGRDEPGGDI